MNSSFFKKIRGEKGQALPMVLAVLAIGGLIIGVSLNRSTVGVHNDQIIYKDTRAVYAAGAGLEYAIWALNNGQAAPTQTPQDINQMPVNINVDDKGQFSLYAGELLTGTDTHVSWVSVNSSITGTPGSISEYTINVTREPAASGNIKLIEVGAALPMGYSYVTGSAAGYPSNMSLNDPDKTGVTPNGANWIQWDWNSGQGPVLSSSSPTAFQSFEIQGSGNFNGEYAWVKGQSNDVGIVGEITGNRYIITSEAINPDDGTVTAKVVSSILIVGGEVQILSWQVYG